MNMTENCFVLLVGPHVSVVVFATVLHVMVKIASFFLAVVLPSPNLCANSFSLKSKTTSSKRSNFF